MEMFALLYVSKLYFGANDVVFIHVLFSLSPARLFVGKWEPDFWQHSLGNGNHREMMQTCSRSTARSTFSNDKLGRGGAAFTARRALVCWFNSWSWSLFLVPSQNPQKSEDVNIILVFKGGLDPLPQLLILSVGLQPGQFPPPVHCRVTFRPVVSSQWTVHLILPVFRVVEENQRAGNEPAN